MELPLPNYRVFKAIAVRCHRKKIHIVKRKKVAAVARQGVKVSISLPYVTALTL